MAHKLSFLSEISCIEFMVWIICSSDSLAKCDEGFFNCDSTRCLQDDYVCDGVTQCLDGTDEENCHVQNDGML